MEEKRWRSGESARVLLMRFGFDSRTRRHMWFEFVVGSLPCSEGFSPGFHLFIYLFIYLSNTLLCSYFMQ